VVAEPCWVDGLVALAGVAAAGNATPRVVARIAVPSAKRFMTGSSTPRRDDRTNMDQKGIK
jgi:hypothetical protein